MRHQQEIKKLQDFIAKYPRGWHSFTKDFVTVFVVTVLEKRGEIEVSKISNQFRKVV